MLVWNWKEPCGEATIDCRDGHTATLNLYRGNAYLIWIDEHEDHGEVISFFHDKQHMKNMLGLNKKEGHDYNHFNKSWFRVTKLRLNKARHPRAYEIAEAFAKAFDDITIEIYKED